MSDIHAVAVHLELTKIELLNLAMKSGLLREDPKKSWTIPELKQHARHAVAKMAMEATK